MEIRTQHTLGSRALHEQVRATHLVGLLPLGFGIALRLYQPYLAPHLVGTIIGLAAGHQLLLHGAYNLVFREDLASAMARRLQPRARFWFPPFLVATRYAFFFLSLVLVWLAIRVSGVYFSPVTSSAYFAAMVVLPVHRLVTEFRPEQRGAWGLRGRATLRLLRVASIALLCMGFTADRFREDLEEGVTPLTMVILWVFGILIFSGSFIFWLDEMRSPKRRQGR